MSTGAYIGLNGSAKKIKNIYLGVGNSAKKIKKAYIGVGGVAKLWWKAPLSYKSIPISTYMYCDREFGPFIAHNTNYIIMNDQGGSSLDYHYGCLNRNGVFTVIDRTTTNNNDLLRISNPGGSGSYVWSINGRKSGNCFDGLDANLVQKSIDTGSYSLNANNRWFSNLSFQNYGYAVFFGFNYFDGLEQNIALLRISDNGTYAKINANSSNGEMSFNAILKNYLVVISYYGFRYIAYAINIQNMVSTQISNNFRLTYPSRYCKNIDNSICFVSDYNTIAYSMNSSFVYSSFSLDSKYKIRSGYSSGSCYENKWYFHNTACGTFSIDTNLLVQDEIDLTDNFTDLSYNDGFDVFDGALYYPRRWNSVFYGVVKVS